jgi:hypothetical protein
MGFRALRLMTRVSIDMAKYASYKKTMQNISFKTW